MQGLEPDKIVLPCRYFFVQRKHENTKNLGDLNKEEEIEETTIKDPKIVDDLNQNTKSSQLEDAKKIDDKLFAKSDLQVSVEGVNGEGRLCRAYTEVFDRIQGGFVVR